MSINAVPVSWTNSLDGLRRLATAINQIIDGRSNARGSFTITENTGTTVVTDQRVGTDSVICFMPLTVNAAAAIAAGAVYVSSRGNGTFTLTHANNAQTDRTFEYSITG